MLGHWILIIPMSHHSTKNSSFVSKCPSVKDVYFFRPSKLVQNDFAVSISGCVYRVTYDDFTPINYVKKRSGVSRSYRRREAKRYKSAMRTYLLPELKLATTRILFNKLSALKVRERFSSVLTEFRARYFPMGYEFSLRHLELWRRMVVSEMRDRFSYNSRVIADPLILNYENIHGHMYAEQLQAGFTSSESTISSYDSSPYYGSADGSLQSWWRDLSPVGSEEFWYGGEFVSQSEEMSEKDVRQKRFERKDDKRRKKAKKVVESIRNKMNRFEVKMLVKKLKSEYDIQAGLTDMLFPPTVLELLGPFFDKCPTFKHVVFEVIRACIGMFLSTTREQLVFHLTSSAMSLCSDVPPVVLEFFKRLLFTQQSGEDFVKMLRDVLKGWNGLRDGPLIEDIKKSVMLLVALGFTKIEGLRDHLPNMSSFMDDKNVYKHLSSFDIVSYALEVVVHMCERVHAAIEAGSLKGFFFPYVQLIDLSKRYDKVVSLFPHAMAGNLDEFEDIDFVTYDVEIRSVYKQFERVLTRCAPGEKNLVLNWKNKLAGMITDLDFKLTQVPIKDRPWSVNLIGSPGVGKTLMVNLVVKIGAKAYGHKLVNQDIYFRDTMTKFEDGYTGQFAIVEDDKNQTKAGATDVNENASTIRISNNAVALCNMADVSDKGKQIFRSKVYVTTTNVPDAQASIQSNEPAAVLRRSLHVVVEVKDEFRLPNSSMLDSAKCNFMPVTDDAWNFTVLEVNSRGHCIGEPSRWWWEIVKNEDGKVMNRVGMHDLMMYLKWHCDKHIVQQNAIVNNFFDLIENFEFCEHGSGSTICRICNALPDPALNRIVPNMGHTVVSGIPNEQYDTQAGSDFVLRYFAVPAVCLWLQHLGAHHWQSYMWRFFQLSLWSSFRDGAFNWFDRRYSLFFPIYLLSRFSFIFALPCLISSIFLGPFSWWSIIFFGNAFVDTTAVLIERHRTIVNRLGAYATLRAIVARDYVVANKKKSIAVFIAATTAALGLYKLTRKNFVGQGANISDLRDFSVPGEWDKPAVRPIEVGLASKTTRFEDLHELVGRKIAHLFVYKSGSTKGIPVNIIPLKSGCWLAPAHVFFDINNGFAPMDHDKMRLTISGHKVGPDLTVPIDRSKIERIDEKDMCVVYIAATAGHMRDLTGFLAESAERDFAASYVYRDESGLLRVAPKCRLTYRNAVTPTFSGNMYSCVCPYPTFIGLCGSVQVADVKTPFISSFHIAGVTGGGSSLCIPIIKSEVISACEKIFSSPSVIELASEEQMDYCDGDETKELCYEMHSKCTLNYFDEGSIIYLGRFGERAKPTASVYETFISPTVEEEFGAPNLYGPPSKMRGWQPWRKGMTGLLKARYKDPNLLSIALKDYHDAMWKVILHHDFKISPLDEATVLGGLDGDPFMSKMDMNTSSGHPFKLKKETFIDRLYTPENKDHNWSFTLHDWMRKRVDAVEDRCRLGLRPNCVFTASLKNESKTVYEIKDGEKVPVEALPRIFYGASFELTYLFRKYFLPVTSILKKLQSSEMCVGINVVSPEWDATIRRLLKVSEIGFFADQKSFDTSVTPDELVPHYSFMIRIADKCGYAAEDIRIMKSFVTCVAYPTIDFSGDLIQPYCLNPSGHGGTVETNSMVNSTRHRMAFFSDVDLRQYRYTEKCCTLTYGDDSSTSVSPDIIGRFNLAVFAQVMAENGVEVTAADKVSAIVPFQKILEGDFLKRRFVYNDEMQKWMAPLAKKSIMKRLHVGIPSTVLTEKERVAACIEDSNRDFFQYGRVEFDAERERLQRIVDKHELLPYLPGCRLKSYDDFVSEYKERYLDVRV